MLFGDGYRPNVCIVLCNEDNNVLLFHRIGSGGWQFPQGGIDDDENPTTAMYRELYEEVGLEEKDVKLLAQTNSWYRYNIPLQWLRTSSRGCMHGQKQIWFLLQINQASSAIDLQASDHPEFNQWSWVKYWQPIYQVIDFKKSVYQRALIELSQHLPGGSECQHQMFLCKKA